MLSIIHFNENCSSWTKDPKVNEAFVNCNINYIYAKLEAQKYLYLCEIYNVFCAEWDINEYNHCFRKGVDKPRFSYQRMDNGEIKICIYW